MKCEICKKPAKKNLVICKCEKIRAKMFELSERYAPTNGCDNCWGDLGGKCSDKCRQEFKEYGEFWRNMWSLIHLIY